MADKLKQAIELIKSGERERARQLLIEHLKTDPKNDSAWVWMASVVETAELKQECLEEALKYNPKNEVARRALAEIQAGPAPVSIPSGQSKFDQVEARPIKRS